MTAAPTLPPAATIPIVSPVRRWLRNGTMPKTAPHAIWPKKQEGKSMANCTHATQQKQTVSQL